METLTEIQVEFLITIQINQLTNCPSWIGGEDGYLINQDLIAPLIETYSLSFLKGRGFRLDMNEEEQFEWFGNHLSHTTIFEMIADEYGEDVGDLYENDSVIDFSVTAIVIKEVRPSSTHTN